MWETNRIIYLFKHFWLFAGPLILVYSCVAAWRAEKIKQVWEMFYIQVQNIKWWWTNATVIKDVESKCWSCSLKLGPFNRNIKRIEKRRGNKLLLRNTVHSVGAPDVQPGLSLFVKLRQRVGSIPFWNHRGAEEGNQDVAHAYLKPAVNTWKANSGCQNSLFYFKTFNKNLYCTCP